MERDGRSTITFAFMTIGRQSDRRSVIKVKKSDHCYQTHCLCHFISCSRYSGDKHFFFAVALPDPMLDSSVWEKYSSVSRQLWWKEVNYWSRYFTVLLLLFLFFQKRAELSFLIDSSEQSFLGYVNVRFHQYFVKAQLCVFGRGILFKIPHNPGLALISFRGSGLTKGRISCITNTFKIDF